SALTRDGVAELWASVLDHRDRMTKAGELDARRREQQVKWMWAMLEDRVFARLKSDPVLKAKLPRMEAAVAEGRMSAAGAVTEFTSSLGVYFSPRSQLRIVHSNPQYDVSSKCWGASLESSFRL